MAGDPAADPQPVNQAIVERIYSFDEAAMALRHLIDDRPFGKVVLTP
jgi:NADPH:quinone reductase-like Zn-dependent oxidoreductase